MKGNGGAAGGNAGSSGEIPAGGKGFLAVPILLIIVFLTAVGLMAAGKGRILYPAIGLVVMVTPTLWVCNDSQKRGMSPGFWTALQPFTFPVGLLIYFIHRRNFLRSCPGCGAAASAAHRFCGGCGFALTSVCCECARPVEPGWQVCPHCGTRVESCIPAAEEEAAAAVGWRPHHIVFLAAVDAVIVTAFLVLGVRAGWPRAIYFAAACLLLYLPLFNWVFLDSRKRHMSPVLWGILVVLTLYVGLVIYLSIRRTAFAACPICGAYRRESSNFCPYCGSSFRTCCTACGTAAPETGRFCTNCGRSFEGPVRV